jgi:hypothetical protein
MNALKCSSRLKDVFLPICVRVPTLGIGGYLHDCPLYTVDARADARSYWDWFTAWSFSAFRGDRRHGGGIGTAFGIVEGDFGAEVAWEVARWLVLYRSSTGAPIQVTSPVWAPRAKRDAVRRAQDDIGADPAARHTVVELARSAAMSARHFVRVFLAEVGRMGVSPTEYRRRLDRHGDGSGD